MTGETMPGFHVSIKLGPYEGILTQILHDLRDQQIVARLWEKDHTLWKSHPAGITNRMGWLSSPQDMISESGNLYSFARGLHEEGFTKALLLGMGGSSLAPEVFRKTFGVAEGFIDLSVLSSTIPETVSSAWDRIDPGKTLFIVSTKSGDTVETSSLLKYFFNHLRNVVGAEEAGQRFIAITDPGSALAETAERYGFRSIFLNNPDIGGRYSALSHFGLLPAALIGVNVPAFLEQAISISKEESLNTEPDAGQVTGAVLGAILGELALRGRDKLTFSFSPMISSFGDWIEQLLAESTGKEGKGILPVIGEPAGQPSVYGNDRVFVSISLEDDDLPVKQFSALQRAGHPIVQVVLADAFELAGQCFYWEVATAVAAWRLRVNPFDQPDVETAKAFARQWIVKAGRTGGTHEEMPVVTEPGMNVYGDTLSNTPGEYLDEFLSGAGPGHYISLQAFLPQREKTGLLLQQIQALLRDRYHCAVTMGWGPRYLHSTGQLHKGDSGKGLFIQFTGDDSVDIPIPDDLESAWSSLGFGLLKTAQALGDFEALQRAGRRIVRIHFGRDTDGGLERIIQLLQSFP